MVSSIQSGARVLVTGATGYIGAQVADQFLNAGYVVVGTSRTAAKAQGLKNYFDKKYGTGKFEVYETGDLVKDGAFDGAVRGKQIILIPKCLFVGEILYSYFPILRIKMLMPLLTLHLLSSSTLRTPLKKLSSSLSIAR